MPKTFEKKSVSSELAHRMISAAEKKAQDMGKGFAIAVVDEDGVLKAFRRMDNAPLLAVAIAQDKAYTAAGFSIPTDKWHDFIKDDPPLALGAPSEIGRLVTFGGGYPIEIEGKVVGGFGVSGGHYKEDMEVAKAGLGAAQ
jgi:uncharacterized protein GlcG (DUF336 family)